jgi:hypothetical protein
VFLGEVEKESSDLQRRRTGEESKEEVRVSCVIKGKKKKRKKKDEKAPKQQLMRSRVFFCAESS